MAIELYYQHIPKRPRPVSHHVEFLPVTQFVADESLCQPFWELIGGQFRTRSKFLAIWPSVRFVALHRRGEALAGFLLVSAPVNWQIDYVTVDECFRREGIAAALVNATLNEALVRGVPYVMLTSKPSLRPLYEDTCGFTVVGERPSVEDAPPTWTGEDVMPLLTLGGPVRLI